jgi:tetraacyldisaccharide 4'-kinase
MARDGWARGNRPEKFLARRGGAVELLGLPAALHSLVTGVRNRLYDRGWLAIARVDAPVVSVGNLTAGGTGKTPMVVWLVGELRRRGYRPGILSRGYRARGAPIDGPNDEGRLLASLLPDIPREEDAERAAGARRLIASGSDVIVLDDGFQHRRLGRDLDLVLVDALRPWGLPPGEAGEGVRALLPRGLLRERPQALGRSDAVVITRSDQVDVRRLARLEAELERLAPGRPIALAAHRALRVRAPDGSHLPLESLAGRELDLLSGIGNPDGFEATVLALGARVRQHARFPDHHPFRNDELFGLGEGAAWILTTAKDAARLPEGARPVHVLEVELALLRGASVLDALLDGLPRSAAMRARANLHEGLHG